MIPIYDLSIARYTSSAINAITSGRISYQGEYINLVETQLKTLMNSKYCILMANGTCATHCMVLSLKYKHPNVQTVFVSNNSYVAAWNSVLSEYNINQIRVMKMNIDTWNISTDAEYINSLDKHSAVLIVHNLGNIVDVPRLKELRPDLVFLEDNCEGLFGKYGEVYSGTSDASLCSSCSFFANKIITSGEGGAFFTQHDDVYNYIKSAYSQGVSNEKYLHDMLACNYRMTNMQAGLLYEQLGDIRNILDNKRNLFRRYEELLFHLTNARKVILMVTERKTTAAPWIFALRIVNNRKTIVETVDFFKRKNVDIRPFFYPINRHGHLRTIPNHDQVSTLLNKEVVMIPSSPEMPFAHQQQVVDAISSFISANVDPYESQSDPEIPDSRSTQSG